MFSPASTGTTSTTMSFTSLPKESGTSSEAAQQAETAKRVPDAMVLQKNPLSKVVIFVKDGFLYVYGMVGDTFVRVQIQVTDGYVATKARIMETLDVLSKSILMYKNIASDRVLSVRARLLATGVQINKKMWVFRDATKTKALQMYARATELAKSIPVPVKVQQAVMLVQTQAGLFAAYLKNGYIQIYGRIDDALVRMKTQILATSDALEVRANEVVLRVQKVIRPYLKKLESGVASVKGKVGDTVVIVKGRTTAKLVAIKKAIEALPLTAKITNGVNVVKTKAGDIVIYVESGYMHIKTKVGDAVLYVKAVVTETQGVVKVKIIEQYTSTKAKIFDATSSAQVRLLAAIEQSKAMASDRPVAASVASGAILGASGGGAAGLATGGIAGAACGVPLALLTFGLSIPVGAVIGGGVGTAVGATAGGAAGAVGGSAAGYTLKNRESIKNGAIERVNSLQVLGRGLKAKLCSGTGGTI